VHGNPLPTKDVKDPVSCLYPVILAVVFGFIYACVYFVHTEKFVSFAPKYLFAGDRVVKAR